jgi:hypothetical protein
MTRPDRDLITSFGADVHTLLFFQFCLTVCGRLRPALLPRTNRSSRTGPEIRPALCVYNHVGVFATEIEAGQALEAIARAKRRREYRDL